MESEVVQVEDLAPRRRRWRRRRQPRWPGGLDLLEAPLHDVELVPQLSHCACLRRCCSEVAAKTIHGHDVAQVEGLAPPHERAARLRARLASRALFALIGEPPLQALAWVGATWHVPWPLHGWQAKSQVPFEDSTSWRLLSTSSYWISAQPRRLGPLSVRCWISAQPRRLGHLRASCWISAQPRRLGPLNFGSAL